MEKNILSFAIFGFIGAILLAVFAGSIADNIAYQNNPLVITGESLDISSARIANGNPSINASQYLSLAKSDWVTNSVVVTMTNGSALTADTDYYVNYTNHKINFSNTTTMFNMPVNTTAVAYQNYESDYIQDGTARTINGLVILFFIIGGILFVYDQARRQLDV